MKLSILFFVSLALVSAACSETLSAGARLTEYSIPNTVKIDLPVAKNGIAYEIYIDVPSACGEDIPKCSAVYMLDAEYSFGLASLIVQHLSDRNRIPPVVSIAIGYPDKSKYRLNRSRDYTPYYNKDAGYGEEYQKESGGGPAFLDVIKNEIIPFVEKNYPVATDNRTLVGHSYGGLFVVSVWMADPEIFDNYIIVSPSLWYNDGERLAAARRVCAESPFKAKQNLFLAVGEYEEQPENDRAMVSDLEAFNAILSECASRTVSTYLRVFEDETHASIFPAALSTGLRKVFQ